MDENGNALNVWDRHFSWMNENKISPFGGVELQPNLPWEAKVLHEGVEALATSIPPIDKHNIQLLNNVHPVPWTDPNPASPIYNLVVIGGGAGGLVSSIGSVQYGAKVALIEAHLLGGDCTNFGCVPSKALIKAATVAHTVRNAADYGVHIEGGTASVTVDFNRVMERMRAIRAEISNFEAGERLAGLNIDVYLGHAVFDSPNSVVVNGKQLRFRKCIIATGGKAYVPKIPGLETVKYLTNESLFNLTELPKRLIVVGGGPIGVEMAQTFQRFGTQVTILVRGGKILDKEDVDAAQVVQQQLQRDGVRILTNTKLLRVEGYGALRSVKAVEGKEDADHDYSEVTVLVTADGESAEFSIAADQILLATGRKPTMLGMGLEAGNVAYSEVHGITVKDSMCSVSNPNVYAAGDCCSHFQFTHAADWMARIAIQNALFFGTGKFSSLIIPWCTFTEPEIAHVGLYPHDMEVRSIKFDTYIKHFSDNDRSICEGEEATLGFVKIHVKEGGDEIVGCTIVGQGAGDMISEVTTLMHAKMGLRKLTAVIHPYPTRADAIRQIGDAHFAVHGVSPFTRGILARIFTSAVKG